MEEGIDENTDDEERLINCGKVTQYIENINIITNSSLILILLAKTLIISTIKKDHFRKNRWFWKRQRSILFSVSRILFDPRISFSFIFQYAIKAR